MAHDPFFEVILVFAFQLRAIEQRDKIVMQGRGNLCERRVLGFQPANRATTLDVCFDVGRHAFRPPLQQREYEFRVVALAENLRENGQWGEKFQRLADRVEHRL